MSGLLKLNLWNVLSLTFINVICNNNASKILIIKWPFKMECFAFKLILFQRQPSRQSIQYCADCFCNNFSNTWLFILIKQLNFIVLLLILMLNMTSVTIYVEGCIQIINTAVLKWLGLIWNHVNMLETGGVWGKSVNDSARSGNIIGISARFSLTCGYIVCSHYNRFIGAIFKGTQNNTIFKIQKKITLNYPKSAAIGLCPMTSSKQPW